MRTKSKNNYIIMFLMTILIAIVFSCMPKSVYAENLELETEKLSDKFIEWLNLPEDERENTIAPPMYVKNLENNQNNITRRVYSSYILGATNRYNLRDNISGLKIKNQQQTEECWAFVTTTQLESYMLLNKNRNIEYSPRHIEYSTARTFLDGINTSGYYREVNTGGNYYYSYGYLTSGKGPILEEDMPFVNSTSKIYLSDIEGKTVQAQLEEYKSFSPVYKEKNGNNVIYTNGQIGEDRVVYSESQINNFRNEIKNHIMRYGAVGSMTATNAYQYYSNESNYVLSQAYNCDSNQIQANHAIAIIGWDDNYSASNFNANHRPTSNGAWIIQNSYGSNNVFNNGLLYISYEDFLIEIEMFGLIRVDDVDYDYIHQYDELGQNAMLPINSEVAFAANVFSKTAETEYITEIGLYINGTQNYAYDIYINNQDDTLNIESFKHIKTISQTDSNYITVKLDNPLKVKGNKFVVAVKYTSESSVTDVPIEAKLNVIDEWYTATANSGESYISQNGLQWYDINNANEVSVNGVENMNACIKVFTNKNIDFNISSSDYEVGANIITSVLPNTNITTFINNFTTNGNIEIYDANGKKINNTGLIATGMKLKLEDSTTYYSIYVKGDTNGDGKSDIKDILAINKHRLNKVKLSNQYLASGDVNNDGNIDIKDILKINKFRLNKISSL